MKRKFYLVLAVAVTALALGCAIPTGGGDDDDDDDFTQVPQVVSVR